MQIDLTALPEDAAVLQSIIRDVVTATLQRDAQMTELTVENDKLRALIQKLLCHRFGRHSEQLSPDQLRLAIEVQSMRSPWQTRRSANANAPGGVVSPDRAA